MYGFIKGKYHSESGCVLTTGGIGFAIKHCGDPLVDEQEVALHAYTSVSENDISVWTFDNVLDKQVFLSLVSAPGVGPTTAAGLISSLGGAKVANAITSADTDTLKRAPRVGASLAKKIIANVKLPEGLQTLSPGSSLSKSLRDEAVAALTSYGFKKEHVLGILDGIEDINSLSADGAEPTTADVVRYVLAVENGGN